MAQKSYRLRFQFWLDLTKDFEERIAARIETLKEERQFSRAIREGLALWLALREHDISLLLELHPWIADHFQQSPEKPKPSESAHNDQIKALQAKIDMLTELVLQKEMLSRVDARQRQKQLSSDSTAENRDLHKLSDGLLEVKTAKNDTKNRSDWNFVIASAIQVYGNYDALPAEIIAYGVETGRIPPDKISSLWTKPHDLKKKPDATTRENPRAITGATVRFDTPDIDLDSIPL